MTDDVLGSVGLPDGTALGEVAGGGRRTRRIVIAVAAVVLAAGGITAGLIATSGSGPSLQATLVPPLAFAPGELSFGPDNTLDVMSSSEYGPGGLEIWNLDTKKLVSPPGSLAQSARTISGYSNVTFSPDGRLLAGSENSTTVGVWNVATGKQVTRVSAGKDPLLALSSTGTLATADPDGSSIDLWDTATGSLRESIDHPAGSFAALGISPAGTTVGEASASGTVFLWNASTRKETGDLAPRISGGKGGPASYMIQNLTFSATGTTLAIAEPEAFWVWSISEKKQIGHMPFSFFFGLSTTGTIAADGGSSLVELVDLQSDNVIATLKPLGAKYITKGTLSANGTELAAYDSLNNHIYVWDNIPG